uniref:Taperin n=1 Tax=Seriola dumerili TaxID=41447 RepID=A0A3B4TEN5_SERDU
MLGLGHLEAGQESPRMPAWKREILERRKAKGGGSGGADSGPSGGQESLVLQESLGPLEENPFIKLEKERRRRQDRENAARPVQHILELYGSVPGIRTIRAENIIIIESDPDYFPEAGGIRAKEVVPSYETGEGQGRVSRMLQKFDSNYGKLQKKSHSTENLLDLDCSASSRPRLWPKPEQDLVPKPRPGPSSVSSFRQRFEESGGLGVSVTPRDEPDRGLTKPTTERDWEGTEVPPKPKVPCSPETRSARAEPPSSPISSKVARSSPYFEIRPSPKPDLDRIPDGDTQARALANLRLQSRNSFTVIPARHPQAASSQEEKEVERVVRPSKPEPPPSAATSPAPPPTSEPLSPSPALTPAPSSPPALSSPPSSPAVPSSPLFSPPAPSPVPSDSPAPSPVPSTPSPAPEQPPVDQLPVTNIDDIEVEPPQRVPVPSPMVQRKKGNTFTVVPTRTPKTEAQPRSPEPQQEASTEAPPGSTPPQAPYAQLGSLLKKRYPAVEEIEVIGGYLSLEKSCLSKTGSTGKKLKISFNESSLQSTYEYPSESSAWDSGEEDEEEKRDGKMADEQPSMVGRIHIPRPSFTGSPTHTTNSNDLSSYIPKHSVDFSAWQEHKHDDSVYQEETTSQQTQMTEEVMVRENSSV